MAKFVKLIKFDTEARNKLLNGVDVVARAVSATLGPRGRHVAIDLTANYDVAPTVLRDGVSVARSINLEDPHEDMGARLLKQAALKTVKDVGDGTTLTTILAHAIITQAHKAVQSGVNPMRLKKELEEASALVLSELKSLAKQITTDNEKEQIATISASDSQIGKLVAEALNKVGKDGVLTVEEGKGFDTSVEYKEGMEIDRGYLSPYFVTDQERVESVITEPYILFTDKTIKYSHELLPFIENFANQTKSRNLVIFASNIVDDALATLVANRLRGLINVCAIQAPAFGGRRIDELQDLATFTGGQALLADSGRELQSVTPEELGTADKVIADRDKTIILGGKGDKKGLSKYISDLKQQLKIANTEFDKEIKQQRLANLSGSIAVINVGAATEVEMKEKKERVIDAVAATKAAIEEGIVAGGEITLLNLASKVSVTNVGGSLLKEALKSPFKKLVTNAGMDYAEALQLLSGKIYPFGIDVTDGKVKDLIKEGVIDPVKVIRSALENAVSVASMIITTEVLITDTPEDQNK